MRIHLFLILLLYPLFSVAQYTPLEVALEQKWLALDIRYVGSSGRNIEFSIANISGKPQKIALTPGYLLQSGDSTRQDLLVVDGGDYTVPAKQKRTIVLQAYCCKMRRSGPGTETPFHFTGKNNASLVQIAAFLFKNGLKNSNVAQEAIWAVSDTADLSLIYDPRNKGITKKLIELAANLTVRKVPWYRAEAKKVEPGPQIVKRHLMRLHADWNFELPKGDIVTFAVYDQAGQEVSLFFKDKTYEYGKYTFSFTYETNKLPKGHYFFRMTGRDSGKIEERELVL